MQSHSTSTNPTLCIGGLIVSARDGGFHVELDGCSTALSPRDAAHIERFLSAHRQGEARTGFRVPVQTLLRDLGDDLMVTLVHRNTIYDAVCIDLSLTGILIRCADLAVVPRTGLLLRLVFDDFLARIDTEVVRVEGDMLALSFPPVQDQDEWDPPSELLPIFNRLEQAFLRQRSSDV